MPRPDPYRVLLRYADLTPSLGYPGGSCHFQERIRDDVKSEKVQDYLIEKHQREEKYTDPEEQAIYGKRELDIGRAGKHFQEVLIRPHAQRRMDLRGVRLNEVKDALREVGIQLGSERRRQEKSYERGDLSARDRVPPTLEALRRSRSTPGGAKFVASNGVNLYLRLLKEWQEPGRRKDKRGRPLMEDRFKVRVETVIRQGGKNPDPVPEDECPHFKGDVWEGYSKEYPKHDYRRLFAALKQAPTPGVQTFVRPDSQNNQPTTLDREKQVVLPPGSATPGGGGREIPQFSYNAPDSGSEIKPRTLGLPGEQYGHPSKDDYNTVTRRTMTADSRWPGGRYPDLKSYVDHFEIGPNGYPDWYFVADGSVSLQPDYGVSDAALPRGEEGEEITKKTAYKRRWKPSTYQRKSRGRTKHKRQQYYRRNKSKIKMRQKRWRTKNRNKPQYKQWERKRRRTNRRRRVASVSMVARAYMCKHASVLTVPDIAFVIGPKQQIGYVHSISPMSGMVTVEMQGFNVGQLDSLPVELFMRIAGFLTDQDADAFFDLVDVEVGPEAYEDLDPKMVRECARRYDRDPDSDQFKNECFDLTGQYDLSSMSADQLDAVSTSVVQESLGGGIGRSTPEADERSLSDADDPEISDSYDPHLYYGEVNVER